MPVSFLINSLHMIVVIFFFSAAILQYKQLKIKFHFSNESFNEEQEIGSIILRAISFVPVRFKKTILTLLN